MNGIISTPPRQVVKYARYRQLAGTTFQSDLGIGADYVSVILDLEGTIIIYPADKIRLVQATFYCDEDFSLGLVLNRSGVAGKMNFGKFDRRSGTIALSGVEFDGLYNIAYYFGTYIAE